MGVVLNYTQLGYRQDKQLNNKNQEYLEYISEHIENVKSAYRSIFSNPALRLQIDGYTTEQLISIYDSLEEDIMKHDESKFSNEEFYAYRVKFFPTEYESDKIKTDEEFVKTVDENFQEAWKHHYENNNHHPKFWKGEEMSLIAILHMICDWEAMSKKFGNTVIQWYTTKADQEKKDLNPKSKALLESILEQIYDVTLPKEESN